MNKILDFHVSYYDILQYTDAMEWLVKHMHDFPTKLEKDIGDALYRNFRFVNTLPDNQIVFANCVIPGITAEAFYTYRKEVYLQ